MGSPVQLAGKAPATRLTPTIPPMPHARLFPAQTSDLPALRPAVFGQPKSPVIIKTIKQLPSQAYTDVPLLDKSKCNWDLWNRKLRIVLEGCGLNDYAFGLLDCLSNPRESVSG